MKKLIDKMKPEFAAKLETAKKQFPETAKDIERDLKKNTHIHELKFGTVISMFGITEVPSTQIYNQFES